MIMKMQKANIVILLTPVETLKKVTKEGYENGFQVCTHAIGDMANREVLNILGEHLERE